MGRTVHVGDVYHSNSCGDFEVIEELEERSLNCDIMSKIRFLETGTEMICTNTRIVHGSIRDPYYPNVCGVACLGKASYKCKEYKIWYDMIHRCYNKNNTFYNLYGGMGVSVADEWLCFENFLKDFPSLPGYDKWVLNPSLYSLDKDYLQQDIPKQFRVYSKDTCVLMLRTENSRLMVLEDHARNSANMSSPYVGVWVNNIGRYIAEITVNGKKINLGHFTNEIAAANAYNFAARKHCTNPIQNDVPYMSPTEYIKYNSGAKLVAKVVVAKVIK